MQDNLKKLNEEQREAVIHKTGPLLIVAGAGTGKTTVITQRIVYLVEKGEAKPEEILAVTFSEKAAGEMEERVDKLLSYGYVDLWISTFHALCERILRDHALDIGLPADFKILDQTAGWLLLRQNLDKFQLKYYKPLGNPTKFIQALISHFSHCKDQTAYPEDYLEYAEGLKTNLTDLKEDSETERIKEVANAYHVYQRLLLENSYLDFGDLINYCLKLFLKRPLILEKYREKFKYILVDEFQDTNWAQYELIKILAEPKNNLTVCADDDQAIYRWRGASFSNIIQFKKDFPKAEQIALVRNYRSTQNILDKAYKFIKANDPDRLEFVNKINKKLIAEEKGKGNIEHIFAKTLYEEVRKVIERIIDILKKDKEANYNDFAILVRANDAAIPFTRALERAEIPYQFLASKGLYSKPIVLDIISYFKLLDNYHESTAVYRILNLPFLNISTQDIMKITQYSYRKTKSIYETMQELPLVSGISQTSQEKINFILGLVHKHSALATQRPVSAILISFLEDSGYLKYLITKNTKEQLDLLNQFYKRIKKFEETNIEPGLKNFMEEILLEIDSGEEGKLEFDPELGPDMVKVMTIHGAKGLEFKYVFLVNMVDKRFPTIERSELIELPEDLIKDIKPAGDIHLQEERRICYVAMTRAKKELYFTSAKDYGGSRNKRLSRFLIEMGYQDKSQNGTSSPRRAAKPQFIRSGEEIFSKAEHFQNELVKKPKALNLKPKFSESYLPEHFSFSQLAAFEKCPLQYKFGFIFRVPTRRKAVFSFGKTMHNTLHSFLKQVNEEKQNEQNNLFGFSSSKDKKRENSVTLDDLVEMYEKNWIDEWYENKKQKEEYYKLGKKIIKDFYSDFAVKPPKILKIDGNLALEIPFNLKIAKHTIRGQIDRIDELEGGTAVIDYKTGSSKNKLNPEDKEQLIIYQIAAEEIFGLKPKELVYFYLNDGTKASFISNDKEKNNLKEKIVQKIGEIKNSDFGPTPGWQCSFCDFKEICEFAQR